MNENIQRTIKRISSDFARADMANRENKNEEELDHLLYAVRNITILLLGYLDDEIKAETTNTYALSLKNSAIRIHDIILEMKDI